MSLIKIEVVPNRTLLSISLGQDEYPLSTFVTGSKGKVLGVSDFESVSGQGFLMMLPCGHWIYEIFELKGDGKISTSTRKVVEFKIGDVVYSASSPSADDYIFR